MECQQHFRNRKHPYPQRDLAFQRIVEHHDPGVVFEVFNVDRKLLVQREQEGRKVITLDVPGTIKDLRPSPK
jgi:hypothetical protein